MTVGITTVGAIDANVLERIDRTGSNFVSASTRYKWISDSYKELYDILIQKFGDDYFFATPYTFTTNGSAETFSLPADFYKLYGVDLNLGGSQTAWVSIRQFTKSDRNRYAVPNFQSFYGVTNLRYRLRGNNIWFSPIPMGGQNIRILYAPRPTELTGSSDTVDGISGWEEYIVCDVAIKYLGKEESDPSLFIKQKADILARIEQAAENRNVAEPQTVSDNQGNWGPFGHFSNGEGGWSY